MEALEKWMIIRITLCQTNTLPKWMSFLNHFFNSSLPLNDYSAAFKYRSPSQQRRPSPSLLSDSYSMPLHVTSLRLKVKTSWLLFNSSKKNVWLILVQNGAPLTTWSPGRATWSAILSGGNPPSAMGTIGQQLVLPPQQHQQLRWKPTLCAAPWAAAATARVASAAAPPPPAGPCRAPRWRPERWWGTIPRWQQRWCWASRTFVIDMYNTVIIV